MTLIATDVPSPSPEDDRGRQRRRRGGLAGFAVRRLLTGIGTMAFVLVFNFFLFRLLPGDPIALYTRGRNTDREQIAALRRALNKPIGEQFVNYLKNPFSSGVDSTQFSRPVWDVIGDYVWPTLVLLGTATVLSAVIGIAIGIKGGWRRGSTFDRTSTAATLTLYAMPEFWLGMVLLILFSTGVGVFPGVFPSGGTLTPGLDPWSVDGILDQAWHLCLPATTLTLAYLAEYALVMRSSLVDELGQDYLMTARAKGLMDRLVRRRHAVPNALLPTITLVFLNIGFVVSGAITVETVFSWPGLGLLSYQAIRGPDVPLLQAIFLLFSLSVVAANLVADVVVAAVDPRVRT
ncbi:MAG: peptide/nickel transport system permease protein [Actinomycetota bacterium]|jgi:peptide/nickel transport system permease protein|nr:peptide/nickel transport system permease protein [Actinomycetota bacterium]